jgi:hypothetical protein
MNMNRNKIVPILAVAGVLLLVGIIWFFMRSSDGLLGERWHGVEGEPVDVALGFYEGWLEARRVGDNEPFTRGILSYEQVGDDLRERLSAFDGKLTSDQEDPVLCQVQLPEGLRTVPVYKQDEAAQFLVRSTTKGQTGQSIVTLVAKDGLWQITDITCGNGEMGPQGEFSFDKTGFLLKQVPAPLDSNYWHLVFEEAGVLGHAVPLFIDGGTVCVNKDGTEAACDDNLLKETIPARVKGEMSESGVAVKRIELVETVSIEE